MVEEVDRDAAHNFIRGASTGIKLMMSDPKSLYEAFAAHRLAARREALEEAAIAVRDTLVASEWPPTDGDMQIDELQAAIRKLAEQ